MSTGGSYHGSKISLVSNAGIRYEGNLFTVDTAESTVTLSKVRSFGTEDRPCDHPVAQRDEMYDYIVFRASDIKDLLVCEGPKQTASIAQDPAILQHSGAVSSTTTPAFRPPNTYAAAPAPFAPFNQLPYQYGAIGGMMPNQFGAGQVQRPQIVGRQTPPPKRKSPTMEQAVQASGPQSPDKVKTESKGRKEEDKHDHREPEPQPQRRRGSREEQRRGNRDNREPREEARARENQERYRDNQNRNDHREGNRRRDDRGPRDQGRDQGRRSDNQQQPYRRGRGGRGRGHRQQMAKDPIKVGTDFDFDASNAQFDKEALEDEFESKLKIVNGDEKSSEHDHEGSGSETPTSETQDDQAFYEPEKSFFDSISCESTNPESRTRPSRREEYKMNTETFGVPFARGRGRGRGGYYRGGYNRGGYNNYQGNYNRSGGGYRGRNNYQSRGGSGGGTAWNNRRNRNDWGRGDAPQRRDRGDDNRRREEAISHSKGTAESSQKEDIKVAEGS